MCFICVFYLCVFLYVTLSTSPRTGRMIRKGQHTSFAVENLLRLADERRAAEGAKKTKKTKKDTRGGGTTSMKEEIARIM